MCHPYLKRQLYNLSYRIKSEGYYVVLASGRPTEGMIPTARDLKLPEHHSYIISYNGSNNNLQFHRNPAYQSIYLLLLLH
jgi:hydroxymethylpyrimidine pyrophosphatase-like HAD family hydrolase